ncbi:MAG: hypothetical protein IKW89_06435 [Bacteroidales bacterium]|nr:hypothetical protein [Bacteroidales bacterium]
MKRFIITLLACALAFTTVGAQSRKAVKQAKKDTKIEVKHLKSEGYKSLDNIKLEDAVNGYLTSKYSTRNAVEVIGKAMDKDLNVAKAEARSDALYGYPDEDVVDSFFVYKKTRGRYEVVCYAAVKGRSAKDASKDRTQSRRQSEGTEAAIATARAEQEAREAQAKEDKARKKAEKEAKKAEKKAEAARQKAVEAREKADDYR